MMGIDERDTLITKLQAQLAERDKTVLEQQARIMQTKTMLIENSLSTGMSEKESLALRLLDTCNLSALEAHDREVRIECLEDAAKWFDAVEYENSNNRYGCDYAEDQLRHMANELKESK